MMRAVPLALTALLLAGCLESPAPDVAISATPPVPTVLPTLIPPTVTPTTTPTPPVPSPPTIVPPTPEDPREPEPSIEPRILHRNKRSLSADPQPVQVPGDIERVQLSVESNDSWSGSIVLRRPTGEAALTCTQTACGDLAHASQGSWTIDFPDATPGELVVTVLGHPYPADAPVVPPHHLYISRYAFTGPATNRTDQLTVSPGHAELRGHIMLDAPDTDASYPARIILSAPDHSVALECANGQECPVSIPDPAAGLWRVSYQGGGNGTSYVNLSLLGETRRPGSMYAYLGDHSYWSHANRGDFGEGFTVPPGVGMLRFIMTLEAHTRPQDTSATALVELRDPSGAVVAACGWPLERPSCTQELEDPPAGMWEVRYSGTDPTSVAKVAVKVE